MIDLIIFDLDGVLINTEHTHYDSLCDAIHSVTSMDYSNIRDLVKIDGSTTKNKLQKLRQLYGFNESVTDEINRIKQARVIEEFAFIQKNEIQINMLSELFRNYKLAVGSNSRRLSVDTIIDRLEIRQFFSSVISVDDVGIEKPDPAIFNCIMKNLNVHPSRTLILEDSLNGIEAARRSGAHVSITSFQKTTLEFIKDELSKI